jgi:transcriptional regulator with XRE-family HTH domain
MTPAECTIRNLAVGTRIRDRRVELAATMPEFTAVSFARRLNITVGHLYQIETGRVRASAGLLARIGSLLAMDVNRLLAANGQIAPALEEALLRCPAAWGKITKELE